MTVKDLYELLDKRKDWSFSVWTVGGEFTLAYASASYDVEGTNKDFDYNIYSVKDLFEHEVAFFRPSYEGIWVYINKFPKMKYWDNYYYKDENGHDKVRRIIKVWNEPSTEES